MMSCLNLAAHAKTCDTQLVSPGYYRLYRERYKAGMLVSFRFVTERDVPQALLHRFKFRHIWSMKRGAWFLQALLADCAKILFKVPGNC